MLILLPPSEGKFAPRRGKPLRFEALNFPELTEARIAVVASLVELCASDPEKAATTLSLGPTQADLVARNAALLRLPAARADRIYTGVLYDALGLDTVDAAARRRATRWLAMMSSAFGVVRPSDPIPAYRLSGDTHLPGIGTISSYWRDHLDVALTPAAGNGLVIDLRSSMYAGFWRPSGAVGPKVATLRVLHEVGAVRKVVSHFNKATKGRIVRALLEDGGRPRTPAALAEHLTELGWTVEVGDPKPADQQLDVIVHEI